MADREELQRQARSRARVIQERIAAERDASLLEIQAGAQALDDLQVMLEAECNSLDIFADGELKPEKAVLIRDRRDMSDIMRITRKGNVMCATVEGETHPFSTTHVLEEMFDDVYARLAKRPRRSGN
jgi:hypothetical protein